MNLASLQEAMRKWLETGNPDFAARFGESARPGLDVYLNNYRMQLLQCLEVVFPHTLAWLGRPRFEAAARRHIMAQPPTDWTLDAYPKTFAAEVEALFPDDTVTADLVRLELALDDALTAADKPPLTRAMFAQLDWELAGLVHASGGRVLRHHSNAAAIWSALSRAKKPPLARPALAPVDILVWRSNWLPCFRVLDPDEAEIFAALVEPLPIADICTRLEQELGTQAAIERTGLLLARWADDAAISVGNGDTHSFARK